MAAQSSNWQTPSGTRVCGKRRAIEEPIELPMPSPIRKTARIKEKVYVVAPKSRERMRVQITSELSAVNPDIAMDT